MSNASVKTNKVHSSGIKPLNAPRVVNVRTDPAGSPTAVQIPPAITSPRARSAAKRRGDNPVKPKSRSPKSLVSDGAWMKVAQIENLWKVNDEWWRGPDEEIARLYYVLRLENGQQVTVYLDLIANCWRRQSG